jgi:hypothetical protein
MGQAKVVEAGQSSLRTGLLDRLGRRAPR